MVLVFYRYHPHLSGQTSLRVVLLLSISPQGAFEILFNDTSLCEERKRLSERDTHGALLEDSYDTEISTQMYTVRV